MGLGGATIGSSHPSIAVPGCVSFAGSWLHRPLREGSLDGAPSWRVLRPPSSGPRATAPRSWSSAARRVSARRGLIGEFVAGVRQRGGAVLSGSCPPSGGRGTPYAPFVEALRTLVHGREPATLPALLGPGRIELARLLPEIDTRPRADATLLTATTSLRGTVTRRPACSRHTSACCTGSGEMARSWLSSTTSNGPTLARAP